MIVNASSLIATHKTFRALFLASFDAFTPAWMRHAMTVPTQTETMVHNWLGRVGAMKEWVDTKVVDELRGFDYTVKSKDWENTLGVFRKHMEDDLLGLYNPRIADLGQRAKQHPDQLLSGLRTTNGLCYDGQNFYDTDHAEGDSGSQANTISGTGVTAVKIRDDWFSARKALRKFKDDKGEPFVLNLANQDALAVIPADLEAVFDEVNNPGPGATFPKTTIPYEIDPRLTDVNDWYTDFVGAPVKPFLYQTRKPINFVSLDNPNTSEIAFDRALYKYGVEGRYVMAYGLWQFSVRITNT